MAKNKLFLQKIFILLLTFVITCTILCVPVNAIEKPAIDADKAAWDAYAEEYLDHSWKNFVYICVSSFMVSGDYIMSKVDWIFDFQLPLDQELMGGGATLKSFLSSVQNASLTVGKMLCFLYFLLELLEHATRDSFTVEAFVKSFGKIMILFILFDPTTIDAIGNFASGLNDTIVSAIGDALIIDRGASYDELIQKLKSGNWLNAIAIGIEFVFKQVWTGAGGYSWFFTFLLSALAAVLVGVGRLIELAIYQTLLPLGMASIYSGGLHSPGFRYLKKFIAIELQGGIMYAAFVVGVTLVNAVQIKNTLLSGINVIVDLAFGIGIAAIIVRSKRIAEDVMGV